MWLYTLMIPLFFCIVAGLPLLIKSQKNNRVFLWEYSVLFCPVLIWNLFNLNAIGSQSLSNISEVYIVCIAVVTYGIFRFFKQNVSNSQKVLGVIFLIFLPIILRLFFPSLPE